MISLFYAIITNKSFIKGWNMDNQEFNELLKKAKLTKKAFSELVKMNYASVTNWKQVDNIPLWVESWLTLYIENKECKELKEIIKANVCKD